MATDIRQLISPRTLAIISGVLLIPTVILWVVDYRAGLALLGGLALAWALFLFLRWAAQNKAAVLVTAGAVIALAVVVIAVVTLLGPAIGNVFSNVVIGLAGNCQLVVSDVSVAVDGENLSSDLVTISGNVTGSKSACPPEDAGPSQTIEIPPLTIPAESRGFMLREVKFDLADVLAKQVKGYDGYRLAGAKIRLELQNFPRGSFYQARDAKDVEQTSYLDTETIKWSPPAPGITFSYIPPGWGIVRPIVDVLYGAQSIDKLVLGALGSVGTLVIGAVAEVFVGRFVKKPLEGMLDKKGKKEAKS